MNYSDFGVTCAEELEQDEWSLSMPTFQTPKGGVLTVVGKIWVPNPANKGTSLSRYICVCSSCGRDEELFGDGVFSSSKSHLLAGKSPCACSAYKQTTHQAEVLSKRALKNTCWEFLSVTEGTRLERVVKIRCSICKKHSEIVYNNLISRGIVTCVCSKVPDFEIEQYKDVVGEDYKIISGSFLPRKSSGGIWRSLVVQCTKCGNVHNVPVDKLKGNKRGRKSWVCKCRSTRKAAHKKMIENIVSRYRDRFIPDAISVHGEKYDYSLVDYRGTVRKVTIVCKTHGPFKQTPATHLRGCGCPRCSSQCQTTAYIHQVVDGGLTVALKFGIAKDWEFRMVNLNTKNLFELVPGAVWEFSSVSDCKDAERECKKTLKTGVLSAREMKDGWTETVSVLDLEKVIAIYEKHGGKRIK
uniref:CapR homology domain-containing protein n=1 Tax=Salmonella phage SalP219 TaxID=3158864 RepID=A0AAU7PHZ9_9CAUD